MKQKWLDCDTSLLDTCIKSLFKACSKQLEGLLLDRGEKEDVKLAERSLAPVTLT